MVIWYCRGLYSNLVYDTEEYDVESIPFNVWMVRIGGELIVHLQPRRAVGFMGDAWVDAVEGRLAQDGAVQEYTAGEVRELRAVLAQKTAEDLLERLSSLRITWLMRPYQRPRDESWWVPAPPARAQLVSLPAEILAERLLTLPMPPRVDTLSYAQLTGPIRRTLQRGRRLAVAVNPCRHAGRLVRWAEIMSPDELPMFVGTLLGIAFILVYIA